MFGAIMKSFYDVLLYRKEHETDIRCQFPGYVGLKLIS